MYSERIKYAATLLGLAGVYFLAGKLGLTLAFVHPSATAVWPSAGIALAAFLVLGYRVWPGVLIGAFLVNLTTAGSVATSVGMAIGNTLEGLMGAFLVNGFAGGREAFRSARNTFRFALLAGMLSTTIAATFGGLSLCLGGYARWSSYAAIWLTWWLGDGVGIVVVTPLMILKDSGASGRWVPARIFEFIALLVSLVLVGQIVFCGFLFSSAKGYPLEYLCIPFLIWAAFRFGPRETVGAVLLLSGMAIWGTMHGFGPFVRGSQNESLLLLQSFMGVAAVMSLALSALFAEHRRAEARALHLAVSDPLTGLANYRKLVEVLDAEIRRSARTGRSFAMLLLDLDRLKHVNDTYGHLIGSRALCRLAEVLRLHSRDTDTAARFGGDEFALVLPEADAIAASQVAHRISERLANDGEQPPISVSIGTAVFPKDGMSMDLLLRAADQALYEQKRSPAGAPPKLEPIAPS